VSDPLEILLLAPQRVRDAVHIPLCRGLLDIDKGRPNDEAEDRAVSCEKNRKHGT